MFLSCEHDTLSGVTTQTSDDVMIAVTAAEMRKALGLLPWPLFEAQTQGRRQRYIAAGGYPGTWDSERQTGRTTKGALLAFAGCQVRGLGTVHITGNIHVVRLVKDTVRALGLQTRVVTGELEYWRAYYGGGVQFYEDHLPWPRL